LRRTREEAEEEERRGKGKLGGTKKGKAGVRKGNTIINISKFQNLFHIIIPISVQCHTHTAPCVC